MFMDLPIDFLILSDSMLGLLVVVGGECDQLSYSYIGWAMSGSTDSLRHNANIRVCRLITMKRNVLEVRRRTHDDGA